MRNIYKIRNSILFRSKYFFVGNKQQIPIKIDVFGEVMAALIYIYFNEPKRTTSFLVDY